MGRDRTEQTTPDLSSTAPFGQTSAAAENEGTSTQERRHVLPKDLPNAIKHLDDEELDRLLAAALVEAKRRGRSPLNAPDESVPRRSSQTGKPSPRQPVEVATPSLTRGQINAVRAAGQWSHPDRPRRRHEERESWCSFRRPCPAVGEAADALDATRPCRA